MMGCSFSSARFALRNVRCAGAQLLVLFALVLGGSELASAQSVPGAIRGVVTDTARAPLQGVRVGIVGTLQESVTDAAGRFTLEQVEPGRHRVRATRIGYIPRLDSAVVRSRTTLEMKLAMRGPLPGDDVIVVPYQTPEATRPAFASTIDPVARVARLPVLRPIPEQWKQRELRLWAGFGRTYPMQLVRLTVSDGRVNGELWHWVSTGLPDSALAVELRGWSDSIPLQVRRRFRCGSSAADTLRIEAGTGGHLVAVCRVHFRTTPDWRVFLDRLEAMGVWTLPDELRVRRRSTYVGYVALVVESWNGERYRTYHYGNPRMQPSAEARQAAAILAEIIQLAQRDRTPDR
jgi:hypothetical protein